MAVLDSLFDKTHKMISTYPLHFVLLAMVEVWVATTATARH